MILTCPSCSAKFMISSEALGSEGRDVRCGKCAHMWFQPAERDSLDDLAEETVTDDSDTDNDGFDIGLSDREEGGVAADDQGPGLSSQGERPVQSFDTEMPDYRKHGVAIAAALAVTILLLGIFIGLRGPLSKIFPGLGASYAAMGFEIETTLEPDLAFDRIQITRDAGALKARGYIINLTEHPVPTEGLQAELLDKQKTVLATSNLEMKDSEIPPESSQKIELVFKNAPQEAQTVRIYLKR